MSPNIWAALSPDIGWTVWSAVSGRQGVDDEGRQIEPLGGVVVEVAREADEDGEPYVARLLTVDKVGTHHRFYRLAVDDIDLSTAEPPDIAKLTDLVRRLAGDLCWCQKSSGQLKQRKGDLLPHEIAAVTWVQRLTAVIASARPPSYTRDESRFEREAMAPAPGGVFVD